MKLNLWKPMVGLTVLLACSAVFVGCESEDSDSDITPTSFMLDRDLVSYDGTDTYQWETTLTRARAEIRIKDFRAGDATISVYDSRGKLLLRGTLVTPNDTLYTGDNEYVWVGTTEVGTPGNWTVVLGYDQFTGKQRLTMN